MSPFEQIVAALGAVVGTRVHAWPRATWQARLLPGGAPTLLPEPFEPYLGIQENHDFMFAVASGAPHAPVAGVHHVRLDESDGPEGRINTGSDIVIEDLTQDHRWLEVLRVAGLANSPDLPTIEGVVGEQVFGFVQLRDDHHHPTVPEDIAAARPRE